MNGTRNKFASKKFSESTIKMKIFKKDGKKRMLKNQAKIKKPPMTAAERSRKMRALKKAAKNAVPFEFIAINSHGSNVVPVPLEENSSAQYSSDRLNRNTASPVRSRKYSAPTMNADDHFNAMENVHNFIHSNLDENKLEEPFQIYTELFCEPILSEFTLNSIHENDVNQLKEYAQNKINGTHMKTERSLLIGGKKIESEFMTNQQGSKDTLFGSLVKEKRRPMTAAERARKMRSLRKLGKVKKAPMTAAERARKMRALKKAAKNAIPYELIAINSHDSSAAPVVLEENNSEQNSKFEDSNTEALNSIINYEFMQDGKYKHNPEKIKKDINERSEVLITQAHIIPEEIPIIDRRAIKLENKLLDDELKLFTEQTKTVFKTENNSHWKNQMLYRKDRSEKQFSGKSNSNDININFQIEVIEANRNHPPLSGAERMRRYRQRKKSALHEIVSAIEANKNPPLTGAERMRRYRQNKKAAINELGPALEH